MTTIILVRHGENDWVKEHRLAGWISGIHLNANGRKQAKQAAQQLAALPIKAIYSSPVARCMETAVSVAAPHQLEIIQLEEVGEVRYGDWEGKKIKKLAKLPLWRVVQFFPSRMRFPNGEALREVQFRAIQAIETISNQYKDDEFVIVISHADLIKLVLAHYLGVHMDLFQRIVISPASINVISLPENGMIRVMRINDSGPLQVPKPAKKKKKGKKKKSKEK